MFDAESLDVRWRTNRCVPIANEDPNAQAPSQHIVHESLEPTFDPNYDYDVEELGAFPDAR